MYIARGGRECLIGEIPVTCDQHDIGSGIGEKESSPLGITREGYTADQV